MPLGDNISVVVQGPVLDASRGAATGQPQTHEVLASVRQFLPGAELILSTWKGHGSAALGSDVLVESDDPGGLCGTRAENFLANTARQITSTAAGLARATRPLSLKLRSDTLLESASFVRQWDERRVQGFAPRHLSAKVAISALCTYNPARVPIPYHPSDFFQFGSSADLRRLWDIRPPTAKDAGWFTEGSAGRHLNIGSGGETERPERVTPEQFLFISFLRKSGVAVNQTGFRSASPLKLILSEYRVAAHFIPLHPTACGIRLPERFRQFCDPSSILFRDDLDTALFTARSPGATLEALLRRSPQLFKTAYREGRRQLHVLGQRARNRALVR